MSEQSSAPTEDFRGIRFARVDIELEAIDPLPIEGFIGPTLRGTLGSALHSISIAPDGAPAYPGDCLYFDVFEPAKNPDASAQDPTPPYVLHPPAGPMRKVPVEGVVSFGITLFGDAIERIMPLLWALFRHGLDEGMTRERRRFLLFEAVTVTPQGPVMVFDARRGPVAERWDPNWIWSADRYIDACLLEKRRPPSEISLRLTTPLDLRETRDGRKRAVEDLTFQHLVRSLLRNVSVHARLHGDGPLPLDFAGLKAQAATVRKVSDATDWIRLEHHSRRHRGTIPTLGRIGTLRFAGDLAPFVPLLILGTTFHVGRGRTMGFGGMMMKGEG